MFLLSPVAAVLTDRYGMRRIAIIGSIIATLGMFLSSLSVDHSLEMLILTYGIMFGGGTSFAMQPSLAILVHYFKNRLGVANGLVACGAPLFTMVGPFLLKYLVTTYEVSKSISKVLNHMQKYELTLYYNSSGQNMLSSSHWNYFHNNSVCFEFQISDASCKKC